MWLLSGVDEPGRDAAAVEETDFVHLDTGHKIEKMGGCLGVRAEYSPGPTTPTTGSAWVVGYPVLWWGYGWDGPRAGDMTYDRWFLKERSKCAARASPQHATGPWSAMSMGSSSGPDANITHLVLERGHLWATERSPSRCGHRNGIS